MNLIEQLGGYEAAKGLFNLYEYSISFKYYKVFKGDFESAGYIDVFIPDLQKALLEYRRQHNIFEVGDKVVSDFYQLDSVFLISHVCNDDEFIYSNKVFLLGSVFTTSDTLKGECRFLFNEIRHATDEEIKAGKRLGVNQ